MSWLAWLLLLLDIAEFQAPSVRVTFRLNGDPSMPLAGTLTISLSAPDPKVTIAKRPVVVTVGTGSPVTLDAIGGPVSVPCNEDDAYSGTAQDITKGGVASPPTSFSGTATDMTTVPGAPTVDVSFAVNPPAPPAAS